MSETAAANARAEVAKTHSTMLALLNLPPEPAVPPAPVPPANGLLTALLARKDSGQMTAVEERALARLQSPPPADAPPPSPTEEAPVA